MNIKKLEVLATKQFEVVGSKISLPIHVRLTDIMERLKKDFPITHLITGMGTYFLHGEDVPVVYSDDSLGTVPMSDLLDYFTCNKVWTPINLNNKNEKLFEEFINLMDFLEETPYLELFEWEA